MFHPMGFLAVAGLGRPVPEKPAPRAENLKAGYTV